MTGSIEHQVRFIVGSRKLLSVPRRLVPVSWTLEDLVAEVAKPLPDCGQADGYRLQSAPQSMLAGIARSHDGWLIGGRQDYARHFIRMNGSFEDYLAGFSGKTRSTLRRKARKVSNENGGQLDIRTYRTGPELDEFLRLARPLDARTYQARLLDAGLPEGREAQARMQQLAEQDRLRAFLLFLADEAIAYLYLPVVGDTLVYAHLGYAPEQAHLSPGTVLQLEALERLFAERRFRYFDFTEGDGSHKALFGKDSIACSSLLLLKGRLANRALLGSLAAFDGSVAAGKALAEKSGALASARKLLRG